MSGWKLGIVCASLVLGPVDGVGASELSLELVDVWDLEDSGDCAFVSVMRGPRDVWVLQDGRLLLSDPPCLHVKILGISGEVTGAFGQDLFEPNSIVADADEEYFYLLGGWPSQILKYSSSGQLLNEWPPAGEAAEAFTDIAVGLNGLVYALGESLSVFDAEGERQPGPGIALSMPRAIWITPDGRKWIWERTGLRLSVFDENWVLQRQWSTPNAISNLVVDSDDRVFTVSGENHLVQVFDSTGGLLASAGEFGDGPGQFDTPGGIAVDADGRIYVADTGNRRVQVFVLTPTSVKATSWGALKRPE